MAEGRRAAPHDGDGRRRDAREATRVREAPGRRRPRRARVRTRILPREGAAGDRHRGRAGRVPGVRGAVPRAVHRDHRGGVHADPRRAIRRAAASRRRGARPHARRDGRRGRRGYRGVARPRDEGLGDVAGSARHPAGRDVARGHRSSGTRVGGAALVSARRAPASASRSSTRATTSGCSPWGRRVGSRRSSRSASPNSRASSTGSSPGTRSRCSRSSWRSPAPLPTPSDACRATSSTSSRPGRCRMPTPRAVSPGSGSRATRASSAVALEGADVDTLARAVEDHGSRAGGGFLVSRRGDGVAILLPGGRGSASSRSW